MADSEEAQELTVKVLTGTVFQVKIGSSRTLGELLEMVGERWRAPANMIRMWLPGRELTCYPKPLYSVHDQTLSWRLWDGRDLLVCSDDQEFFGVIANGPVARLKPLLTDEVQLEYRQYRAEKEESHRQRLVVSLTELGVVPGSTVYIISRNL